MKTLLMTTLIASSAFAADNYIERNIPVDKGTTKINMGIINPRNSTEVGVGLIRSDLSAKKAVLVGKFKYAKTKCIKYADEGFFKKCEIKKPNGKYGLKRFKVKVNMKKATPLDVGESDYFYFNLGLEDITSKDLTITYSNQTTDSEGDAVVVEDNKIQVTSE